MRHLYVLACSCSPFPSPQPARPRARCLFPGHWLEWKMAPSLPEGRHDGHPGGRSNPARSVHDASAVSDGSGVSALHTQTEHATVIKHVAPWMGERFDRSYTTATRHRLVRLWPAGRSISPGPRARRFCSCTARTLDHHLRERGGRPAAAASVRCSPDLVVGATGSGKRICRRLTQRGTVRCVVRTTSNHDGSRQLEGLGAGLGAGDLKDGPRSTACRGASAVISTASSTMSRQDGDSIESVDRQGQLHLIDAAAAPACSSSF